MRISLSFHTTVRSLIRTMTCQHSPVGFSSATRNLSTSLESVGQQQSSGLLSPNDNEAAMMHPYLMIGGPPPSPSVRVTVYSGKKRDVEIALLDTGANATAINARLVA